MRALFVLLIAACHHGAGSGASASCATVAEHVHAMLPQDDHGKRVGEVFAARCDADAWSGATRACIMDTRTLHDGHHCKDRLSSDQRAALDRDLGELERKRASELPPECERYKRLIEKLERCDKLPRASRDAFKQAFEMMVQTWGGHGDQPREAQQALIEACHQAAEAIEVSLRPCGP